MGKKTRKEAGFTRREEKKMEITKDKDSRRQQDDSVLKAESMNSGWREQRGSVWGKISGGTFAQCSRKQSFLEDDNSLRSTAIDYSSEEVDKGGGEICGILPGNLGIKQAMTQVVFSLWREWSCEKIMQLDRQHKILGYLVIAVLDWTLTKKVVQ